MKRLLAIILALAIAAPASATCYFREDTASQTFLVGPFLDGTDGITAETGLTVANTDIRVSKAGGNTVAKNSGSCTHDEAGFYQCTFDATDTNTAGALQIYTDATVSSQSIVPVWHECWVLPTALYDIYDGTTGVLTSRLTGAVQETTVASVTSQTVLVLTAGASNNDAYNGMTAAIKGGTEDCEVGIADYAGGTTTVTLRAACPFTVASGDEVRIHVGTSGADGLDSGFAVKSGGIQAAAIGADAITAAKIAADAIGASEIAADAIGASEIATAAIGASEIASDAIGASEIAVDAIGASEIATDAIGSAEMGPDAITSTTVTAAFVDKIWDEVAEDQGSTYTAREILSLLLSEAMGTCTYTQGTRTWVCSDPSGTETRFTLVYGSELDGDRSTSTPAPVTP